MKGAGLRGRPLPQAEAPTEAAAENAASGDAPKKSAQKGEKREGSYTNKGAMDRAVDTLLEAFAKKTGMDIAKLQRVSGGKVEANGRFIRALCKIEISEHALNFFGDLLHEVTHGAAAFNLDGYTGYSGAIMQWYQQTQGAGSAMDRLQEIYDVYHQNDASFTMADALEEFTSEATAGLFSSEEGAQDFVSWLQNESGYTAEQKKTVLQKVAELFGKIVDRIRALLKDGSLSDVAADFAAAQADEAARLRQMFLEVLDGMDVNQSTVDSQQLTEGENKFSLKDIDRYTKKQYNDFGWVVVHDVLNVAEHGHLMSQFADALKKNFKYPREGKVYRILVTDNNDHYNKLVTITGTMKNPKILAVYSVQNVYEYDKNVVLEELSLNGEEAFEDYNAYCKIEGTGFITRRTAEDYPTHSEIARRADSDSERKSYSYLFDGTEGESDSDDSGSVKNSLRMAEEMDKVRHSLGLEAQNSRLTQKIEDYQQIIRQQDTEIRELQRELSRVGVRIFADGAKVAKTAGRLLQGYGAEGIRGTERRAINDALAGLYNQMANEQLTRDAVETEAGEIAEGILKQSKFLTPEVSEYSRAVLDDIKSVGIRLSDAQKTHTKWPRSSGSSSNRDCAASFLFCVLRD